MSPSTIGYDLNNRQHRSEQAAALARHERRRAERGGDASPRTESDVGRATPRTLPGLAAVSQFFSRSRKLRV